MHSFSKQNNSSTRINYRILFSTVLIFYNVFWYEKYHLFLSIAEATKALPLSDIFENIKENIQKANYFSLLWNKNLTFCIRKKKNFFNPLDYFTKFVDVKFYEHGWEFNCKINKDLTHTPHRWKWILSDRSRPMPVTMTSAYCNLSKM